MLQAREPAGWCFAGVEGIEPSQPALETGGVTVRCTPIDKKPPAGLYPASGSWSVLYLP